MLSLPFFGDHLAKLPPKPPWSPLVQEQIGGSGVVPPPSPPPPLDTWLLLFTDVFDTVLIDGVCIVWGRPSWACCNQL